MPYLYTLYTLYNNLYKNDRYVKYNNASIDVNWNIANGTKLKT